MDAAKGKFLIVGTRLKALVIAILVAAFETMNGVIIGVFLCSILSGIFFVFGMAVQIVLNSLAITRVTGVGISFSLLFAILMMFSSILLWLGRFVSFDEKSPDLVDDALKPLFMGYGLFITILTAEIVLYHDWDPSIFVQKHATFWQIVKYVFELTLLGFIPDVLQFAPIDPGLTPVGGMRYVAFVVKIIMAATVISGMYKYLESKRIKLFPF